MGASDFLRGPGGQYEITRGLGAFGGVAYVIGAHAFIAWEIHLGRGFDLTAYSLAFPAGLAAIIAAAAGGAAWKDKGTANAKAIEKAAQ